MSKAKIEIEIPQNYSFRKSMNFVYVKDVHIPELWNKEQGILYIVAYKTPIVIRNLKGKLVIDILDKRTAPMDKIKGFVYKKLNLNHFDVMNEGWQALEALGLATKYELAKGFMPPKLSDPKALLYTGLIKTILFQMVSVPAALHMTSRFVTAFGKPFEVEGMTFYDFPEPEILIQSDVEEIKKKSRISMAKANAIKEVAKLQYDGKLDEMMSLEYEELLIELQKIKGVGYWTAVVTMMAGLSRWSAQSLNRLASSMSRILKISISPSKLEPFKRCAGYLSVSTMFLDEALRKRYFRIEDTNHGVIRHEHHKKNKKTSR